MGSGLPPDDAFLEINDDQRRLGPVNECALHARHVATFHGYMHPDINASLGVWIFILRLDWNEVTG